MPEVLDVAIVGAGAAGVGCGVVLRDLGLERFALLERGEIGETFRRWPEETRFISPSFTGNGFGLMDLNSIALNTSPAFTLGREHPTGEEYAAYLQALSDHFALPVRKNIDVFEISPQDDGSGFMMETSQGPIASRFVIWAGGEFQYPFVNPFSGASHCLHTSRVSSWRGLPGKTCLIIGGGESGMDAAYHLVMDGKKVQVLEAGDATQARASDPSLALSPYTQERVARALRTGRLCVTRGVEITHVEKVHDGYAARAADGRRWETPRPPLMATGFVGGLRLIAPLFEWTETGRARLTEHDESTITPGLFVAGPDVRHERVIFCFIYKFRQRFAVIADALAERLGRDHAPLEAYARGNMYLDDLSCCQDECAC